MSFMVFVGGVVGAAVGLIVGAIIKKGVGAYCRRYRGSACGGCFLQARVAFRLRSLTL